MEIGLIKKRMEIKESSYAIDDDFIVSMDNERRHHVEFIYKLKQIFEVEKRIKEDNVQSELKIVRNNVSELKIPIWFTYNEIEELLDKTIAKIKAREL